MPLKEIRYIPSFLLDKKLSVQVYSTANIESTEPSAACFVRSFLLDSSVAKPCGFLALHSWSGIFQNKKWAIDSDPKLSSNSRRYVSGYFLQKISNPAPFTKSKKISHQSSDSMQTRPYYRFVLSSDNNHIIDSIHIKKGLDWNKKSVAVAFKNSGIILLFGAKDHNPDFTDIWNSLEFNLDVYPILDPKQSPQLPMGTETFTIRNHSAPRIFQDPFCQLNECFLVDNSPPHVSNSCLRFVFNDFTGEECSQEPSFEEWLDSLMDSSRYEGWLTHFEDSRLCLRSQVESRHIFKYSISCRRVTYELNPADNPHPHLIDLISASPILKTCVKPSKSSQFQWLQFFLSSDRSTLYRISATSSPNNQLLKSRIFYIKPAIPIIGGFPSSPLDIAFSLSVTLLPEIAQESRPVITTELVQTPLKANGTLLHFALHLISSSNCPEEIETGLSLLEYCCIHRVDPFTPCNLNYLGPDGIEMQTCQILPLTLALFLHGCSQDASAALQKAAKMLQEYHDEIRQHLTTQVNSVSPYAGCFYPNTSSTRCGVAGFALILSGFSSPCSKVKNNPASSHSGDSPWPKYTARLLELHSGLLRGGFKVNLEVNVKSFTDTIERHRKTVISSPTDCFLLFILSHGSSDTIKNSAGVLEERSSIYQAVQKIPHNYRPQLILTVACRSTSSTQPSFSSMASTSTASSSSSSSDLQILLPNPPSLKAHQLIWHACCPGEKAYGKDLDILVDAFHNIAESRLTDILLSIARDIDSSKKEPRTISETVNCLVGDIYFPKITFPKTRRLPPAYLNPT